MDGYILLKIFIILFLVMANGFFVAAEFAIVKVRPTQIEMNVRAGKPMAKLTKNIVHHLDIYLSATQFGITLASLGLGWIGEPTIAHLLNPLFIFIGITDQFVLHSLSLTIAFIIITFLHIIFGELAPKSLAIQKANAVSHYISIPLRLFYLFFKPIIWILNEIANFALRLVGIKPASEEEGELTKEELKLLIIKGAKRGLLDSSKHQIIQSAFDLSNRNAADVMIPRVNVIFLDVNSSEDEILKTAIKVGYSRIPVYEDTIDNIIGILNTKELIRIFERSEKFSLRSILKEAYFVPETQSIDKIFLDFRTGNKDFIIVINEYGGVAGIITPEDIYNELLGDIQDGFDNYSNIIDGKQKKDIIINPEITIYKFNQIFSTGIPENEGYKTLGGFINKISGRVPESGEKVNFNNICFLITKKKGNRILQVKVIFKQYRT